MNDSGTTQRVGVLLAARDGAPWIAEQIRSILTQRDVNVDIIVADDRSKDGTAAIVTAQFGMDARVTLVCRDVPSGSSGRNFMALCREVDVTGFDYVAFSDQDDIWDTDKLARAINCIKSTGADAYSASVLAVWPDLKTKVLAQNPNPRRADHVFEGAGQGCSFVMRVDFFSRVQDFCRMQRDAVSRFHYHDWLIYLLARAWGKIWYFDSVPCMTYRQHAGNEIGALAGSTAVMRRLGLMRSGWYREQIVTAANLYVLAGGDRAACFVGAETFLAAGAPAVRWSQRLEFAVWLLKNGRRRRKDRAVLALAALAGWI